MFSTNGTAESPFRAKGETRNPHGIFVGKPDELIIRGRLRHRWEDNITFLIFEIGYRDVD